MYVTYNLSLNRQFIFSITKCSIINQINLPNTIIMLLWLVLKEIKIYLHFYIKSVIKRRDKHIKDPCEPNPCGDNTRCQSVLIRKSPVISCECLIGFKVPVGGNSADGCIEVFLFLMTKCYDLLFFVFHSLTL